MQAILPDLSGDEISLGNIDLFLFCIARKPQDLHPVTQRTGDGIQNVGRGDEHHLAQVKGYVQVMVTELPILLWVEHFQERR